MHNNWSRVTCSFKQTKIIKEDSSGRAFYSIGLRPLACWNLGFESCWAYGCLSLVKVTCCQVEVSAKGRSLVQRSPTVCVCVCIIECDQMQH